MSYDKSVTNHYRHGGLLGAIEEALSNLGKSPEDVTIEDLSPVDEFHIGGRQATDHLISQLNPSKQDHILDVGCGLGGAARYVTNQYHNRVTGIDLTPEYIDTCRALSAWVKLEKQTTFEQGSALSMPFDDETFDAGYMLHVGMNIEEKTRLFNEIFRVLRPGASFAIYDVMRLNQGKLLYPVPWATESSTSHLANLEQYKQALCEAGFEVVKTKNCRDFALTFFDNMRKKTATNGGPPALGIHTLMQESTTVKIENLVKGIAKNYIAPIEIIARKG